MNLFRNIFGVLLLSVFICSTGISQSAPWKIKKTAWTDADEKEYSEFISKIGEAVEKRQCGSLKSCLKHPNNPYRGSDSNYIQVFADCAKLSYVLRGYYAWKKGLPFSFASDMTYRNVPGNTGDLRYSRYGNVVRARQDLLPRQSSNGSWKFINAIAAINSTIPNGVYSANYRINFENIDSDKLYSDFYPVEISRDGIQPGTTIYDPNGHVAIVYKVTDDGKIYFIDAHPDNSLTSGLFGTKFVRSNPGQGAGFKKFRPYHLEGAKFNSSLSSYVGGTLMPTKDFALSDHSVLQFFGTDLGTPDNWQKGIFKIDGQIFSYYDYIRMKLSVGNLKLDPVNEIKSLADDLCQSVQDRVESVDTSFQSGIQNNPHPDRLPYNIYGTSGEWEEYSTPSRDARLKTSFKELRDLAENLWNMYLQHDPRLVYSGSDIKGDMLRGYQDVVAKCSIQYKRSNSQIQSLNLDQVRLRLFNLSFDPYHCVELRWGASDASELATCSDDQNKKEWYAHEKWLRNQIDRHYDIRMDLSLSELNGPAAGGGAEFPPNVDVVGFLSH
jgi:hypothetical protein